MDVIQIKNNRIVLVDLEQIERHRRNVQEKSLLNLEKHHTGNNIQQSTVKNIEKMLSCWLRSIIYYKKYTPQKKSIKTPYPVFLTLTLPAQQIHDDRLIKKQCLVPFIQELVRKHGVIHYFWKAELQGNGNIHFHLIIDKYVIVNELRISWNNHLEKLGYLTRYRNKHKHEYPANVDMRKIKNIQALTIYLVKYVCKREECMHLFGAKWGSSDSLKNLKLPYYLVDSIIVKKLNTLIELKKVYTYVCDYCTIFYFNKSFDFNTDYQLFENFEFKDYLKIYEDLYTPSGCLPAVEKACARHTDITRSEPKQLSLDLGIEPICKIDFWS